MKHILPFILESSNDGSEMSDTWKQNCLNILKQGKTIEDSSLSRMARKEVILRYFPMADPNFKDYTLSDIGKYLKSNPKFKEAAVSKVNGVLEEQTPKKVIGNRYSKKVDVVGVDAGYLNVDYKVVLTSASLLDFAEDEAKGKASFKVSCSIPDGIFEGASLVIPQVNVSFTGGYKLTLGEDKATVTVIPKNITVSTPYYKLGADCRARISNNNIVIDWGTYLSKDFGQSIIYKLTPISYLKSAAPGGLKFDIPRESLRMSVIPSDIDQLRKKIIS